MISAHVKIFVDFTLLEALLLTQNGEDLVNNIYAHFNWASEMDRFWKAVKSLDEDSQGRKHPPPLYAHVVHKYVWDKDVLPESPTIAPILNGALKLRRVGEQIQKLKIQDDACAGRLSTSGSSVSLRKSGLVDKKPNLDVKLVPERTEHVIASQQIEISRKSTNITRLRTAQPSVATSMTSYGMLMKSYFNTELT